MYGARVYKTLCACDSGLRRLCAYRPQTKTRRSWGEAARPAAGVRLPGPRAAMYVWADCIITASLNRLTYPRS